MNWSDLVSLILEHGANLSVQAENAEWISVFIRIPDTDGGLAYAAGFAFRAAETSEGEFKKLLQQMVDNTFFNL